MVYMLADLKLTQQLEMNHKWLNKGPDKRQYMQDVFENFYGQTEK